MTGKTKTEVKEKLRRLHRELERGIRSSASYTVGDALDDWLASGLNGRSERTPLADIGYGLWRSGRPHELAGHLDVSRVRRFLRGYASVVSLTPDQASVIPVYLRGRGLQMVAKRVRAGSNDTAMLAQVIWLTANDGEIRDALVAALP